MKTKFKTTTFIGPDRSIGRTFIGPDRSIGRTRWIHTSGRTPGISQDSGLYTNNILADKGSSRNNFLEDEINKIFKKSMDKVYLDMRDARFYLECLALYRRESVLKLQYNLIGYLTIRLNLTTEDIGFVKRKVRSLFWGMELDDNKLVLIEMIRLLKLSIKESEDLKSVKESEDLKSKENVGIYKI